MMDEGWREDHAPVVIVGGGVVGLSMAVALARHDVPSVIFERAARPNSHPRAHVANPRTLEIFRLWGVEEQVRSAGLPATSTGSFVWLTSLSGTRLGEISYGHGLAARAEVTATPEVSCAQDAIESILRGRLKELTGETVCFGSAVTDVTTDAGGQMSVSVQGRPRSVKAQYVIAADGAGSATRKRLAVEMEGPDELARFASIYFHADLSRWTGSTPAVLYWIVNSRVQGVFISMGGDSRYVFHVRINPEHDAIEAYTTDRCQALLRDAVGEESVSFDIRQIGQWIMSGQVAARYRVDETFLVGDSAHRFPPTGGFGMNTGIQDAHNLSWKLAAVIHGWASDSLLDSYETERRPVADANRTRSVANFLRLDELAIWSLDPSSIVERLESDGPDGLAERARFSAEVQQQRGHFDKLEQELGFVYENGAVSQEEWPQEIRAKSNGLSAVFSHFEVGARAPLVSLRRPDGTMVNTTDLFELGFVLLANGADNWLAATEHMAKTGVPIQCLQVGSDLIDPEGSWSQVSGTSVGGAILVRPDGHVAFRAAQPPADAARLLATAFSTILGGGRS